MNIYDDLFLPKVNKTKKQYRLKKSKYAKRSLNDTEKNLLDVSEKITDNADSIRRILREEKNTKCNRAQRQLDLVRSKRIVGSEFELDNNMANFPNINNDHYNDNNYDKKPEYLSQFEAQTFDAEGLPSATNDIYQTNDKAKLSDLERKLSYQEGWSQYNNNIMTYGIVPDDQFTHDNMVPYFSTKHGYGSNDLHNEAAINYKNELFTGNLKSTWNKKQELKPLFVPTANQSYVHGTPIYTEEDVSRYMPGRYRQNELVFDKVQVTPGLNIGYNDVGTHGFHPMFRSLDKTVDELRIKPKITYEGRIIEGKKGQERPIQAPVISYRPESFKMTTEDDLLPTNNVVDGPKTRDNFIMKETDRASQHIEYTGGAYTNQEAVGRNVPEHMREKYKYSTKSNFILPKPLQKFSKTETKFNANLGSYDLPFTSRDQSVHNNHVGIMGNVPGSTTYTNLMDNAKSTLKEIIASLPQTHTNVSSNTMRGTIHPMDIANPTIKETTIENKLNPHASSLSSMQRVYFSDVAKTTTKEQTCGPIIPSNATQNTNLYTNLTDNAKTTIKEQTTQIPYQTIITPINQHQGSIISDMAKPTMKEQSVQIPYQTMTTPIHQQQGSVISGIARTTIKEQSVQIPYQTTITPINQQQRAPNPSDIAKTTTKEQSVQIPYQKMITPINQQQRADISDIARTTLKEQSVQTPYQNMITPINQQQRASNPSDIAKITLREQTTQIPYQNIITPINQHQRTPDPSDIAKTTMKEQTVQVPHQNTITPINQQQGYTISDIAKTTTKEQTVQTPWNNFILPINQQQRAPNLSDVMKTTVKEQTVQIPYQTTITPINQQQRASNLSDITKTTIKEQTIQIPRNNFILPINQQQRAPNPSDVMKTTIKEQTVQVPYQTTITPINQHQRATISDIARTTMKEQTVQVPYQTMTTPINQHQGAIISDIAKTTIKEQTTQIPYQNVITPINQKQRANISDIMKTTIKEQTVQIPYQNLITPINQQQGSTISDVAKNTTKETTVVIPYNTNTTSISQQQGKASTFDRTPLRITTKESTVDLPRQTMLTAINQQQGSTISDVARPTMKEQTVQIPYNTGLANPINKQRAPNPQDTARTTLKEQTVQIPYNTNAVAVDQENGQASTFNRTPLRSTTKETTIDNEYIGAVNNDVYGRGYGYMAENMYAPNTNKQFTCQEVYIAPLEGESKNRSYNDAYDSYHANVDDRKELLHWYRTPTNSNVNIGPDVNNINVELKNDDKRAYVPIIGYSVNNQLDRLKSGTTIKSINTVDSDRFIDPLLLQQLQSNPYNIAYDC